MMPVVLVVGISQINVTGFGVCLPANGELLPQLWSTFYAIKTYKKCASFNLSVY